MFFPFSLGFVVLLQYSLPIVFWMDKALVFICIFVALGSVFSLYYSNLVFFFFLSLNGIKCCNDL